MGVKPSDLKQYKRPTTLLKSWCHPYLIVSKVRWEGYSSIKATVMYDDTEGVNISLYLL